MIRGFFSPTHLGKTDPAATEVPLLDAFLYLPSIDAHVSLQFLVDTGADVSVLHARDSLRLIQSEPEWDVIRAYPAEDFGGAGAGRPYYGVPALMVLSHEDGGSDAKQIRIWIAEPGGLNQEHESLLGRDVLAHYTLHFAQPIALTLERRI